MSLMDQLSGTPVLVSGSNDVVGTTEETVWLNGGRIAVPSTAELIRVNSSNAGDAAAGSGARTVRVFGLDGDYNPVSEVITLNGTSYVSGSQLFIRVLGLEVVTAGANGDNTGDLYVYRNDDPLVVRARAAAGSNASSMATYTTPQYHSYRLTHLVVSGHSQTHEFALYLHPYGGLKYQALRVDLGAGERHVLPVNMMAPPKCDIEVTATAGAASGIASAQLIMERAT